MLKRYSAVKWFLSIMLEPRGAGKLLGTLAAVESCWTVFARQSSVSGAVLSLYWGYGYGYQSMIPYLFLLIGCGLPVYIMVKALRDRGSGAIYAEIRLLRTDRLLRWAEAASAICAALYLLLYTIIGAAAHLVLSTVLPDFSAAPGIEVHAFSAVFLSAVLLRFLELLTLLLLAAFLLSLVKSGVGAFLLTMGTYLPLLFDWGKYCPMGLSSIPSVPEAGRKRPFRRRCRRSLHRNNCRSPSASQEEGKASA